MGFLIQFFVWLSQWAKPLSYLYLLPYDEWKPGKKLKILLVGYNGARNTGADARVVALVDQLKEEFGSDNIELTVMVLDPELVQGYFPEDVHLLHFSTFFFWALLRAASSHHTAILCEGSTLTHTFADALSLFFCQAAGIMQRQGKPCIAYGSEVSELKSSLSKLSRELCKDTYFIARSELSLKHLQDLGLECHLGTDTAWTLQIPRGQDIGKELLLQQGWDGESPLLGVAVVHPYCWPVRPSLCRWAKAILTGERSLQYDHMFFFSDSEERRMKYHRYLQELAQVVKNYRDEHQAFVVVIGMERLDKQACLDLQELVGECAVITSKETPVFHMLSVLKELKALVTSRYHAAVLSMRNDIPIVAVSMDSRLDGLFKDFDLTNYLCHVGDKDLAVRVLERLSKAEMLQTELAALVNGHILRNRNLLKDMSAFAHEWMMNQFKRKDA